jgi:hypothetical protein
MSGEQDAVTVRRLPDGEPQPARIESRTRSRILIRLATEACAAEFPAGVLVEVESSDRIYLGEVLSRQNTGMVMAVEHAVNRAALAEIESVWQKPRGA